jgi:hypothetical protein
VKTPKKNRDKRALAKFETYLNSAEDIQEKKLISDLQLEFYANQGLPDHRFWWAASRRIVRRVLKEATIKQRPKATLFLRLHYPFFEEKVQSILMERHPDNYPMVNDHPWYAVDAYLIAEQYALTAFGEEPLNTLNLIEGAAQLYFVLDLLWFSRLLQSITNVFQTFQNSTVPDLSTWASKLQGWNNIYSKTDKTPPQWFKGTPFLESAQEHNRQSPGKKNRMASVTVIAAKANKTRRVIFQRWLPYWQCNLQRLDVLLKSGIPRP